MRASAFLVATMLLTPAVASAQTHYGVTQGWCASAGGHFRATGRVGTDIGECTILPNAGGTSDGGGGSAPGVSNATRNAAVFGLAAGMLGLIGQMIDQSNSVADREYRDRQAYEIESGLAAQRVALERALHDAQYADSQKRAAAMETLAERMKVAEREMDRSLAAIKEKINANAPSTTLARANPFARPGSPATSSPTGNQGGIRPADLGTATRANRGGAETDAPPQTEAEMRTYCAARSNAPVNLCVNLLREERDRGVGMYSAQRARAREADRNLADAQREVDRALAEFDRQLGANVAAANSRPAGRAPATNAGNRPAQPPSCEFLGGTRDARGQCRVIGVIRSQCEDEFRGTIAEINGYQYCIIGGASPMLVNAEGRGNAAAANVNSSCTLGENCYDPGGARKPAPETAKPVATARTPAGVPATNSGNNPAHPPSCEFLGGTTTATTTASSLPRCDASPSQANAGNLSRASCDAHFSTQRANDELAWRNIEREYPIYTEREAKWNQYVRKRDETSSACASAYPGNYELQQAQAYLRRRNGEPVSTDALVVRAPQSCQFAIRDIAIDRQPNGDFILRARSIDGWSFQAGLKSSFQSNESPRQSQSLETKLQAACDAYVARGSGVREAARWILLKIGAEIYRPNGPRERDLQIETPSGEGGRRG